MSTPRVDADAMTGILQQPRSNGELVFEEPWQGRAFGTALAVVEQVGLSWRAFQDRLIAAIGDDPHRPYYQSWAAALEALVVEIGLVSADELDAAEARALLPDH